jgi:serine protease Do
MEKIAKTPKKKVNGLPYLMVLVAFVAGMLGSIVGPRLFPERITSLSSASNGQRVVSSQSELIASIAKDVGSSVVSITVKAQAQPNALDQLFGGSASGQVSEGAGTGIVLSSDGVLMTNRHVVAEGVTSVSVTTSDGKQYDNVEILARDPRTNFDVAFLKIKGVNNLKPAKIGDSAKMQVGDAVVAIGNALGEFQNTVTTGIISGLSRPITAGDGASSAESLTNLFQTDAAINPGNSGGPLVNMNGEVIGMNTAVAGSGAQNIGFAIPTNDIKNQIASILKDGKLQIPYMGLRYITLNEALKKQFDLATSEGAWLKGNQAAQAVANGSPADKAGLKEGDIITKVNGEDVNQDNPLSTRLSKYGVGETIEITYLRDGKEQKTKVTLEASPQT